MELNSRNDKMEIKTCNRMEMAEELARTINSLKGEKEDPQGRWIYSGVCGSVYNSKEGKIPLLYVASRLRNDHGIILASPSKLIEGACDDRTHQNDPLRECEYLISKYHSADSLNEFIHGDGHYYTGLDTENLPSIEEIQGSNLRTYTGPHRNFNRTTLLRTKYNNYDNGISNLHLTKNLEKVLAIHERKMHWDKVSQRRHTIPSQNRCRA